MYGWMGIVTMHWLGDETMFDFVSPTHARSLHAAEWCAAFVT